MGLFVFWWKFFPFYGPQPLNLENQSWRTESTHSPSEPLRVILNRDPSPFILWFMEPYIFFLWKTSYFKRVIYSMCMLNPGGWLPIIAEYHFWATVSNVLSVNCFNHLLDCKLLGSWYGIQLKSLIVWGLLQLLLLWKMGPLMLCNVGS